MAQPIQYESALPQLANILLGGKTTSNSNSTQTGTTSSTANLNPLTQVFNAASGKAGAGIGQYQALIDSIFQQGAQNVPSIIGAYANATGSRASNNSSIKLAIDELNRQMSTQAMQAILQDQQANQQIAGQAAGGIANATRQTSSSQNTQSQNAGTTGTKTNPMLPMLAGFALNQADKRGWIDAATKGFQNALTPAATAYPALDPSAYPDAFGVVDQFAGQAPMALDTASSGFEAANSIANSGLGADFGMGFGDFSSIGYDSGFDFGSGADYGAVDAGSSVGYDSGFYDTGGITDWMPDLSTGGNWMDYGSAFDGVDFGSFFANGGRVRMNPMMRPRGYADGGVVGNRYVNMAAERAFDSGGPEATVQPQQLPVGSQDAFFYPQRMPAPAPMPQVQDPIVRSLIGRILQMTGNPGVVSNVRPGATVGFANGGVVRRNVNNMGARPAVARSAAMNYQGTNPAEAISAASASGGSGAGLDFNTVSNVVNRASQVGGRGGNARPNPEIGMPGAPANGHGVGVSLSRTLDESSGLSAVGAGTTNGPTDASSAAIAGFGAMGISIATGVPVGVVSAVMDAMGIANTTPQSLAFNGLKGVVNEALGLTADAPTGMSGVAPAAAEGMSGPSVSIGNGMATMGMSMPTNPIGFSSIANSMAGASSSVGSGIGEGMGVAGAADAATAPEGLGGGNSVGGFGGADGSVGGFGGSSSSGGTDGGGDAAAAGVGGGGFKNGGLVSGPGTGTSDSIRIAAKDPGGKEIRYSDSEFVIPAEVVRMTGASPWQALVDAFNTPKSPRV